MEIIRRLFRGERLSYNGRVFQTSNVRLNFHPPRLEVPIHLGVMGPKNLELAGEIADGASRAVLAGNPFGIKQREWTGLRRDVQRGVQDSAAGVAGIDFEDGRRLRAADAICCKAAEAVGEKKDE